MLFEYDFSDRDLSKTLSANFLNWTKCEDELNMTERVTVSDDITAIRE